MYYSNNCELILRRAHNNNKRWQIPFFSIIIIIIIIIKKRFMCGCAIQFFSDFSGLSFEMLDWALVRRTHSNKKRWWQPPSPLSLSSRRTDLFQGFPLD
jgi:hypothetical protein